MKHVGRNRHHASLGVDHLSALCLHSDAVVVLTHLRDEVVKPYLDVTGVERFL